MGGQSGGSEVAAGDLVAGGWVRDRSGGFNVAAAEFAQGRVQVLGTDVSVRSYHCTEICDRRPGRAGGGTGSHDVRVSTRTLWNDDACGRRLLGWAVAGRPTRCGDGGGQARPRRPAGRDLAGPRGGVGGTDFGVSCGRRDGGLRRRPPSRTNGERRVRCSGPIAAVVLRVAASERVR